MGMPYRARLNERTLLNLPGFHDAAFIYTYVEDTSERELQRHSKCGDGCTQCPWNFEPRMTVEIADCNRRISLEFDVDSDEGRANSLHKLDTLVSALRLFREAVVSEFEPYDRRARELEKLRSRREPGLRRASATGARHSRMWRNQADAPVSETGGATRGGSTPSIRTRHTDPRRHPRCPARTSAMHTPFELMSKRRRGFPSERAVKRGDRSVRGGEKELLERLGDDDLCPCGSGRRFQALLPERRPLSTEPGATATCASASLGPVAPVSRIRLVQGDITTQEVDAIVNAANSSLLGGGGVDGAIHRAGGPSILDECRLLGRCATGDAKATGGGRLLARHVIHTVGPVWNGGDAGEDELLASCHRASLRLASELGCRTVAFPAISTGVYRFPLDRAARIALGTTEDELERRPEIDEVRFVLFDDRALSAFESARAELGV